MSSEVFNLAILLTLKDAASSGLDRFGAKLRAAGKDGEKFSNDFEKIRKDLNKDLAIGGIGIAGLRTLGKGVQIAADFQTSVVDLRNSLSRVGTDGKVDMEQLNERMLKGEAIALKLGNALPGTTEDFVQMMQVLKQNGLDAETILNGAADAVGNLAVANDMLPKDIAADFAQYGNLFKLKPEEFKPAADMFSRIYTSTGQTSSELVEAAKYFEGRAGTSLGIAGLKDAEQVTRLFGLFGTKGMRGSIAGTMLTDFFSEYNQHADKIKDLQKTDGIKLDFFDEKGKFRGIDAVFEQMKQFDKLSNEDRSKKLEDIFGLRGMSAANVFVTEGADGWKKFNDAQAETISLQDKNTEKSKTFNNQLEALTGTGKNLIVAFFEPVLPDITSMTSGLNDATGAVQSFVKEHPSLAKTAVEFLAIGSGVMVAYSAIKTLTAGVRIYRLASQFSKSEGLVGMLNATSTAAPAATRNVAGFTSQVTTAGQKVGGLKKDLFSLNNVFKMVLLMETIGFTWDQISSLRKDVTEWQKMNGGMDSIGKMQSNAFNQTPVDQRNFKKEAKDAFELLQQGNKEFEKALDPSRESWMGWYSRGIGGLMGKDTNYSLFQGKPTTSEVLKNPQLMARVQELEKMSGKQRSVGWLFDSPYDRAASESAAVRNLQKRAPVLNDPQVMSSFRKDVLPSMGLGDVKQQFVEQLLQQAFPKSYADSMSGITTQTTNLAMSLSSLQQPMTGTAELFSGLPQPMTATSQAFTDLGQPLANTNQSLVDVYNSANKLPSSFNSVFNSANSVSNSLLTVSTNLANWRPPAVPGQLPGPIAGGPGSSPIGIPSNAVGGIIERDGLAFVHRGNTIVPAKKRPYEEGAATGGIHYAPVFNYHGSASAKDKREFQDMIYEYQREFERMMVRRMQNGRLRA